MSFFASFHLIPLRQGLSPNLNTRFLARLEAIKSQQASYLPLLPPTHHDQVLTLQACETTSSFLQECGDLNAGPHDCTVISLTHWSTSPALCLGHSMCFTYNYRHCLYHCHPCYDQDASKASLPVLGELLFKKKKKSLEEEKTWCVDYQLLLTQQIRPS